MMWKCQKCGGEIQCTRTVKNWYKLDQDGSEGDEDGSKIIEAGLLVCTGTCGNGFGEQELEDEATWVEAPVASSFDV